MSALTERFEDTMEPLGVAAGVFLVIAGLATVAGTPWTTNPDVVAVVITVLGSLATAALGAGLAYLSWTGRE